MSIEKKIYLAVTIDTECDKGAKWKVKQPLSFDSVIKSIPEFYQPLFQENQIKPTWLLSPEVITSDKCVEILNEELKVGAELGTHLHAEFIEPDLEELPERTDLRQNKLAEEVEFKKLANLTNLFKEKFGYQPLSFRAGRFSLGHKTLSFLDKLGYQVDSSVVPNKYVYDNNGTFGHNFLKYPRQPYFPTYEDYSIQGHMNILEVPVSSSFNMYDKIPKSLGKFLQKRNKISTLFKYPFQKQFKLFLLRPTGNVNIDDQVKLIDDYIKYFNDDIFFVMMFHNVDFIPACSPYAKDEQDTKQYENNFKMIVSHLEKYNFESITLSEIKKIFQY